MLDMLSMVTTKIISYVTYTKGNDKVNLNILLSKIQLNTKATVL